MRLFCLTCNPILRLTIVNKNKLRKIYSLTFFYNDKSRFDQASIFKTRKCENIKIYITGLERAPFQMTQKNKVTRAKPYGQFQMVQWFLITIHFQICFHIIYIMDSFRIRYMTRKNRFTIILNWDIPLRNSFYKKRPFLQNKLFKASHLHYFLKVVSKQLYSFDTMQLCTILFLITSQSMLLVLLCVLDLSLCKNHSFLFLVSLVSFLMY